jgi:hypothetical protein
MDGLNVEEAGRLPDCQVPKPSSVADHETAQQRLPRLMRGGTANQQLWANRGMEEKTPPVRAIVLPGGSRHEFCGVGLILVVGGGSLSTTDER